MELPSEATRALILRTVKESVVVLDREWRVRYVNPAAEAMLEHAARDLVDRSILEVFPGAYGGSFHAACAEAFDRDRPTSFEGFSRVLGRWLQTEAHPTPEGLTLLLSDVSDRYRQDRIHELRENTRIALDPAQGPMDVLRSSLRALHETIGFDVAELWTRDHNDADFALDLAEYLPLPSPTEFVRGGDKLRLGETSLIGRAFARGQIVTSSDLTDPSTFHRSDLARATGMCRAISLPLIVPATPDAVICLVSSAPPDQDDWFEVLREFHPLLVDRLARQRALNDLERLFDLSQDSLVVARLDGYFVRVNPQFCDLLGYDEQELLSRPFSWFLHPDDVAPTDDVVTEQYRGMKTQSFVNRYRTADGDYRFLSWKSSPIPEDGLAYGVARDVTKEYLDHAFEAEQRDVLRLILTSGDLEATLDRVALALEQRLGDAQVSIHLRDPDGCRLVIAAAPSMTDGFTRALAELDIADGVGACGTSAYLGEPVAVHDLWTDPRGTDFRELARELHLRGCWSVPFHGGDGDVLGTIAVYRPVAHTPTDDELGHTADLAHLVSLVVEQLETRRRLVESEERFRLLAEATSEVVWDWDLLTDRVWWSDDLAQRFGYDPAEVTTGPEWMDHLHPDDQDRIGNELQRAIDGDDRTWVGEYRLRRSDGRVAYIVDHGAIIRDRQGRASRMIGGLVDQTERRELEQQYLRAQRMESIGMLAGGIAHDLNNVLSPIVMATDLLLYDDLREDVRESVETIGMSARRGADMVRQVLTFARGLDGERSVVEVSTLLADLERIIRDSFLPDIEVVIDTRGTAPTVFGDATQLQQVLLNLAMNAREAMPQGGRLAITTDHEVVEPGDPEQPHDLDPGAFVRIIVEDSGDGIRPEDQERMFEPFFTTKSATTGTGLGLATSLAIVRSHRGAIQVESEPGRGTAVTVWLPASTEASRTPQEQEREPVRGHGELILIVDDEAAVRAVTRQALEAFDYRVIGAKDGAEAVARFAGPDQIDLVIIDIMMPVMDGTEAIRRMLDIDPDAPIIAISGLTDQGRLPQATEAGATDVLRKPFSTHRLLHTVAQVLERRVGNNR